MTLEDYGNLVVLKRRLMRQRRNLIDSNSRLNTERRRKKTISRDIADLLRRISKVEESEHAGAARSEREG